MRVLVLYNLPSTDSEVQPVSSVSYPKRFSDAAGVGLLQAGAEHERSAGVSGQLAAE